MACSKSTRRRARRIAGIFALRYSRFSYGHQSAESFAEH
jgi:hypothetical protein